MRRPLREKESCVDVQARLYNLCTAKKWGSGEKAGEDTRLDSSDSRDPETRLMSYGL